jgi:hypothetical protein
LISRSTVEVWPSIASRCVSLKCSGISPSPKDCEACTRRTGCKRFEWRGGGAVDRYGVRIDRM